MWMLAFTMIHVGYEFDVDKTNLKPYGWDYVVAMTAAAFPWIFVALYFIFVLLPPGSYESFQAWKETLLSARFAAPTSAGPRIFMSSRVQREDSRSFSAKRANMTSKAAPQLMQKEI